MTTTFPLDGAFIELYKLLKATQVAENGGAAKAMIERGEVLRGGEVELRKRAKILRGEEITVDQQTIRVI